MDQIKLVFMLISFSQAAKGLTWSSSSISNNSCQSSSIVMAWDYTPAAGESVSQTDWTKSNGAGGFINIADDFGGTLNPATGYSGRLTRIGNAGLQINGAQLSDSGVYYVVVTLTVGTSTATATVSVHVSPDSSCMPSCDNSDSNPKCEIPQACPVKSSVQAVWNVEGVKYVNEFTCYLINSGKTYSACTEGTPVTSCYSGVPLCVQRKCRDLRALFVLLLLLLLLLLIMFICCGCLDCCKSFRNFRHYEDDKVCYLTCYCPPDKCFSFFCCKNGSKRGKCLCGYKRYKQYCGGCVSIQKSCGCGWPVICQIKKTLTCGCWSCICCDQRRNYEDEEDVEVTVGMDQKARKNGAPGSHTRNQNRVHSENTSNQNKALHQHPILPSLGGQPSRPQPPPPGNDDISTPRRSTLPPLKDVKRTAI